VVTLKGQNVTGPKNWFTPNKALLPNTPLVVLINERSASASEVVSGSLQDMDRAVVMGQTSFGKGLVQNYVSLPYRTQMKLTTAKYYTPSGRCIQRLNYQERGSDGQATIMAKEKKRAFLTQNGRKVFEGGGIDPDKFLDPYQGLSIYKWLEKEHILFDWANDQYNAQPDTLFAAVSDVQYTQFVNYAIQKSQVSLQAKWQKAVANTYADTNFIKKTGGFQINQSQLQNALKTELQANKAAIVQVLNRELMERKFKKIQFFKSWLEYDPETKEAAALLLNTTAYQKILNP
jgi:carboxyl-terminal processing protease